MSTHLSQIADAATRPRLTLANNLRESLEGIRVTGTNIIDIRQMTIKRTDSDLVVQRVYIKGNDSGDLKSVGWVINEGIDCCLVCSRKFSSLYWKHHCRTCGLIICAKCTAGSFKIEGKPEVGSQRMCTTCNSTKDKIVVLKENSQWGESIQPPVSAGGGALPMEPAQETGPAPAMPIMSPARNTNAVVTATPITPSRPHASSTASRTDESVAGSPGGIKPSPINELWTFGAVRVRQVFSAFLFQASRDDRSVVFVNVCHSEHVPQRDSNEEALYLTVGDKGISEDGQSVYTVVVHTSVTAKFLEPGTSATLRREICEQILLGLMRVNLECQFSILYILPDTYTYKERVQSDADKDAHEMDIMTLKATTSEKQWESVGADPIVIAVMPSVAAFFHLRQIHANRNDLTRPGEKLVAQWNKYSHIVMDADGTLSSTSSSLIAHRGSAFSMFRSPSKSRSNSLIEYTRPSELRVETRKQGVKMLVRGTISIPALTGYSIEAPSTVPEFEGSLVDECSGTDLEEESQAGHSAPSRVIVINVLHHQVIDDLIAMGVVRGENGEAPFLLCDGPTTTVRPDGRASKVYNVAVQTGYLKSGDVVGGKVTDHRVSQIIGKINKQFHETADEAQFVLSPIDSTSVKVKATATSGKAVKPADLRGERHVTLVLYEYVVPSSAVSGSAKGGLSKTPSFSSQNSLSSYSSFSDQQEVFVGFTSTKLAAATSAKLAASAPAAAARAPGLPPRAPAVDDSKAEARPKMQKANSWLSSTPAKSAAPAPAASTPARAAETGEGGRPKTERRRSINSLPIASGRSTPDSIASADAAKPDKRKSWIGKRLSITGKKD